MSGKKYALNLTDARYWEQAGSVFGTPDTILLYKWDSPEPHNYARIVICDREGNETGAHLSVKELRNLRDVINEILGDD